MRRRWLAAATAVGSMAACGFDFAGYDPREQPSVATTCAAGETIACYEGPEGTAGVGRCRAGVATCSEGVFGPCEGAIEPEPERCETADDDDCDGTALDADAGCQCLPNQESECYEGPDGTRGVGACRAGVGLCDATGTSFEGACLGQVLPIGEICASPFDDDCDGVANDWCGVWHRRYTTAAAQRAFALDLHPGLLAIGGEFGRDGTSGSLSLDLGGTPLTSAGQMDMYVAVLSDDDGGHVWSRGWGGPGFDAILDLAFDAAGDLYAVGTFVGPLTIEGVAVTTPEGDRDAIALKLDGATGEVVWGHVFTGLGDAEATSVAVADGQVIVGGRFDGDLTFGVTSVVATDQDGFVVALDPASGAPLWHRVIGGIDADAVRSVHAAPTGEIVVGGEWDEPFTLGEITFFDASSQGAFVLGLASDGTPTWARMFDAAGDDWVSRVRYGADGRIYVAGAAEGSIDFGAGPIDTAGRDAFVACLETDGDLVWADVLVAEGAQQANAVDGARDGRAIAGIALRGHAVIDDLLFPGGPEDSWLVLQYDPAGAVTTARLFGDHADQDLHHSRFHGEGALLAGDCRGEMSFGDGPPTETGVESICLAKIEP